jgi:hypothetical protein
LPSTSLLQIDLGNVTGIDLSGAGIEDPRESAWTAEGIGVGDKVVLVFADDQRRVSVRLSEGGNDLEKGRLSATSPLGRAITGAEEGDEVEVPLEDGRQRKVLIESVQKGAPPTSVPADEPRQGFRARVSPSNQKQIGLPRAGCVIDFDLT